MAKRGASLHLADPRLLSILAGYESHIEAVLRHIAGSTFALGRGALLRDSTGKKRRAPEPWPHAPLDEDDTPAPIVGIATVAYDALANDTTASPHEFWHAATTAGHMLYCTLRGACATAAPRTLNFGCPGAPPSKTARPARPLFR